MIVFDLLCAEGHRFEGWFGSTEDFTAQKARSQLACPSCGSSRIERVPSASRFNLGAPEPKAPAAPAVAKRTPEMEGKDPFAIAQMLYSRMLDDLLSKSEDVGREFPAEARRIYYQETSARAIRGQATQQEHQELVDEGIPVARLPVPPAGKLN
ncbi:MAG TPA: DUF1178 family protein [Burkholderiales bacterium]|nr:DUF1178 family protein [Burkholderiales bacterium]